jgi:F0F1-type ATP synthase membrane subunit b/b'
MVQVNTLIHMAGIQHSNMSMEFSIGGFNVKGWMVAVGVPILSTISGGIYFGYDTLNRFYGAEAGVEEALEWAQELDDKAGAADKRLTAVETEAQRSLSQTEAALIVRIQTLEQAIADNDVRGLNQKLAQLSTNMTQILEQQKVLLDLRSQVDKATTITDGLGDTLDVLQTEIDDIWKAYDELADNPL